ncbi:putative aldehyde reductase [Xylariaceae sp. FL0804]|nr:putative aldehyde reductase [Xylariaceae sp. FL0804]
MHWLMPASRSLGPRMRQLSKLSQTASIPQSRPHARPISTQVRRFKLNTGAEIPAIGFGTFQDPDAQEEAVCRALKMGLRLIDTARVYHIEKQVGNGLKASGIPREEVFLGTKLWCNSYHPEDVEGAVDKSLQDLSTPYIDLLMMHYPVTFRRGADEFPRDAEGKMIHGETSFLDTWKAMEKLVKKGKVRALGVSNFSQGELETLIQGSSTVPAVHQMEVHPYLQQKDFNVWLKAQGIHVVQFSPLGNMNDFYRETGWSKDVAHVLPRVIDQPLLQELGRKYDKSAVQVVLAWGVNSGRSVIPKSTIDWQVKENVEADFELAPEDIDAIAALDVKARFNDPSLDYQYRLYRGLEGTEGTKDGRTH